MATKLVFLGVGKSENNELELYVNSDGNLSINIEDTESYLFGWICLDLETAKELLNELQYQIKIMESI